MMSAGLVRFLFTFYFLLLTITHQYCYGREIGYDRNAGLLTCVKYPIILPVFIAPDPGSIGSDQTICSGTTAAMLTNITFPSLTAPLYFWQKSTISGSTGFTNIPGTNSQDYSPGVLTQTTWFRRAAYHTGDTIYTDAIKITVLYPSNTHVTADQTVCSGTTPAQLTGLVNDSSFSYQWLSSTTSQFTGFTPAAGINNLQNYNPGSLTQTTWFARVVSGICPNDTTPSIHRVKITVTPPSVGGTISGGGTFCQGPSYTFLTLSGYTGSIVKWQSSTSPTFASNISDISFTSSPYPATTSQLSNLYYRAIVKNGVCPPETSSISSPVIVIAQTVAGQVSGGGTVCAPTNSTTLTLTGYTGSIIKWQSSLTADFSSPTDIINTTNSLTATNLVVKMYYRAVVQNGSCTISFSSKDSIIIAPPTLGGILSGGATVCTGTNSTTLTVTGYAGHISNWQWCSSRDFTSGINNISNNSNTYTATNLTATRYYRAVIVSLQCVAAPTEYSAIDSIIVIPQAVSGTLSGGAIVCGGVNSTLLTLSSYLGSIAKWESSPVRDFSSGVVNLANTTATYTAVNVPTTTYYRVIVTSSPCPSDTSSIDSIVVVPQTVGGTLLGGGAICPGNTSKLLTLTGYTGTILKWQSSTTSNFSSGVTDINHTGNTYTVSNISVVMYYRVVVQNVGCAVLNSTSASVSPPAVAGTLSGGNNYCSSTNNTTFTLIGNTGSIVRWESSTTPDFSSGVTQISNTISTLNPVNIAVTTYYRVLVSGGGLACPGVYSNTDSIVIHPTSVGGIVSGNNDSVCAGTNSTILTLSGYTGTIQWQVSTSSATTGFSNITGANNTTYTATNLSVKTYYRAIVTSGICASATSAVDSILMRPEAIGGTVSGANDTVCTGTNSTVFTLSGYSGTIQWQVSTTSAGTGFSDIPGANNSTYTATNLSIKTYYRALVSNGICTDKISAVDSVLIELPSVGGTLTGADSVCSGTNSALLTLSGYTGKIIRWESANNAAFTGIITQISNTTNTYTATNLSATTYYRAVVQNGNCASTTSTVKGIVVVSPSFGGFITAPTTVCINSNSTVLSITSYSGTILRWESSTTSDFSGAITVIPHTGSSYTATNISTPTYFRAVVQNGICPLTYSQTGFINVQVQPNPGTVVGGNTVCVSSNSTLLTLTGYQGNIVRWESSLSSDFSGTITTIPNTTATYSVNNITTTTYYRAVVQYLNCATVNSGVAGIIVSPLSIPGTVTGSNDSVCSNTNSTPFTLTGFSGSIQWQSSTTSATAGFSNISGANTNTYIANNLAVKTYFRAIVTSGACPAQNSSVDSVWIIPNAIGGTVSGDKDTVCAGTNSTTLTLSGFNGNIQWQSSTTSAVSGFSNISGANTNTYIANNLTTKTYFRAIVTIGTCSPQTSSVDSVFVNPISVGGTVTGSNDTVCIGTNSTILTLTGFTGGIQWQSSTVSATDGFSNISGANTNTYIANNLAVKIYFRAIVTSGICPAQTSSVDSVLVNPISVGGTVAGNKDSVCTGTNSTTFTLTGFTGSIQWQSSTTSATGGFSNINGATNSTYIANNLTVKTYFRAIVKNGVCPAATSIIDSVTVLKSIGGVVSQLGGSCLVCPGSNTRTLVLSGYTGKILYWQYSTKMDFSSGVVTIATAADTLVFNNIMTTTYYRVCVQFLNCSAVVTSPISVNVATPVVSGTLSGGASYCSGINNSTLTLSGLKGGIVRWESCPNDSFLTGVTYIANRNTTLNVINQNTTTYYRALVANTNLCPGKYSNIVGIIIYPVSVGGTVSGSNDTVCSGVNSTILTLSGFTGSIQWQSSTTSATEGFSNISGATGSTFTASNLTTKTYFRAIVTSGVCSAQTSSVDSVSINPLSVGGTITSSNDTVCSVANSTTFTLSGFNGSIQWQSSTTSSSAGFSDITGAADSTYIANNLSTKTYFRAIVTNGVCLAQTSSVDSVLVNPISIGGTVSGSNDTVCSGVNSTILTLSGFTGSIQWQSSTTSATDGFSNISGASAFISNANNLTTKTYFRAIVTSGVCPSQTSSVDSVFINPVSAGGTITISNDTVCNGINSTTLRLSGSTGSIQWQSSTTSSSAGFSDITGAADSTYIANNLTTKTYFRAIVTSGVCPAQTSSVDSVWINPLSVGGTITGSNDTVCSVANSTTFTLSGFNGSIQWQSSTTSAADGFSNISGAIDSTYIATNLTSKTYFRVIVTNGVCAAAISSTDSISVDSPITNNNISGSQLICSGSDPATLLGSSAAGGNGLSYSYSWIQSNISGTSTFSSITNAADSSFSPPILTQSTWFRRIVNSGVCSTDTSNAVIVEVTYPITNNSIGSSQIICLVDTSAPLTGSTPSGGNGSTYTFKWLQSVLSDSTGFTTASGAANDSIYAAGVLTKTTWFKRIVISGACAADTSNAIQITVKKQLVYALAATPLSIVYGSSVTWPDSVTVKYSDSSSALRPVVWDTSGYNPNIGSYQYSGTIVLDSLTCNPINNRGLFLLTILPREITYRANDDSKILGSIKSFPSDGSAVTLVNGTLVNSHNLSSAPVASTGSIASAPIGTYPIIIDSTNLRIRDTSLNDVTPNYKIYYQTGVLIVSNRIIKLGIHKTAADSILQAGDSVTYTIRIIHNGSSVLQSGEIIYVKDSTPPELTIGYFVSSDGMYNPSTGALTLSSMFTQGDTLTLTLRAFVSHDFSNDWIANYVRVTLPDDVLNTGESVDSVYIRVVKLLDLSVIKTVDKNSGSPGDTLRYKITVKNNGPGTLFNRDSILIRDFLPDSFVNATIYNLLPSGSNYNINTGVFFPGDTIATGDSMQIVIQGIIHQDYTAETLLNRVKISTPPSIKDTNSTNDSSWAITRNKPHTSPFNIIASGQIICKGNKAIITVGSNGITNPVYTWYADSLLTTRIKTGSQLDTLLLSSSYFYVTAKGDNKTENKPGEAKKILITVHDYASDTMMITDDKSVCHGKSVTLKAASIGIVTNPVFTWYANSSLTLPIAVGDSFPTGILTRDTLFYVTIKGSNLCESRELHTVRVTIKRDCGTPRIGLAKSLTSTSQNDDGSYNLTFIFIAANQGDEHIVNVRMEDDLKPVFPGARITVLRLSTPGNWLLNPSYDGVSDIQLLNNGNRLNIGQRETIQLDVNVLFNEDDTSTSFKNIAQVMGNSEVSGKPIDRESNDGLNPDSLGGSDSGSVPTPIVINRMKPTYGIFIPDGFSPNGDGINDFFVIENADKYTIYIAIVNRWGNLLYENHHYDNSWDGKATKGIIVNEGSGVPDGTYFCIVEYTNESGKRVKRAHSITIAR